MQPGAIYLQGKRTALHCCDAFWVSQLLFAAHIFAAQIFADFFLAVLLIICRSLLGGLLLIYLMHSFSAFDCIADQPTVSLGVWGGCFCLARTPCWSYFCCKMSPQCMLQCQHYSAKDNSAVMIIVGGWGVCLCLFIFLLWLSVHWSSAFDYIEHV